MTQVFAGIDGQDNATAFLTRVCESGRAVHAYLLAGGSDTQRDAIALRFAAALLAGSDQQAFDQALRGTHPDLHMLEPQGAGGYLVEQVRELTHDAELAPIRASRKVYLIAQAQRLQGAPANALLKTLEEPPLDVVCILTAANEQAVLQTLRSRCEVVVLNQEAHEQGASVFVANMMEALAAGCDNRTLVDYAKRFVARAREGLDELEEQQAAELEAGKDYLSQGARKQLEQAHKRALAATERAALLEEVQSVRSWLRTRMRAVCDDPTQGDDLQHVLRCLDVVDASISRISYNVTPQLAIEAMCLEIREALCQQ